MADLAAEIVAERLRDRATRSATLTALERHAAPIPTAVSLAAAPALLGLTTMDAAEVERDAYDRAGLLLGRLFVEAVPDVVALHGAAFGEGGYERLWNSDSVLNVALRQPAAQLTRADAVSYACTYAYEPPVGSREYAAPWSAAGLTVQEFTVLWLSAEPIISKKKLPDDSVPTKIVTLLLELLKANELPELAADGAWTGMFYCMLGRPSAARAALEHGAVELAVEHLKAIGSPADRVSLSRGRAGYAVVRAISEMCRSYAGEVSRPDLGACVVSGLFDLFIEQITAVAAAGVDSLQSMHHGMVYVSVSAVRKFCAQPGCEHKIRSTAGALAFFLLNDVEYCADLGLTTTAAAASICENPCTAAPSRVARLANFISAWPHRAGCSVFGRDEGGSEFCFSAQHVEIL
jgi:hypothetical protein